MSRILFVTLFLIFTSPNRSLGNIEEHCDSSSCTQTMATILVTGGAGFIGSHVVVDLLEHGYNVIVVDNCVNAVIEDGQALPESLKRVEKLTNKSLVSFHLVDLTNENQVEEIFKSSRSKIQAVIHLAALKAVGESCLIPLKYYENNLMATIVLLKVMKRHAVDKFIFSSSATVYGIPKSLPINENHVSGMDITNPYGRTKYMIEEMLKDEVSAAKLDKRSFKVISLRYFNPIGAHPSGEIGEDPKGQPNNLMPFVAQVAVGRRPFLNVFGSSFKTPDGTGVRDYIHITDLANGHVAALDHVLKLEQSKNVFDAINLGSGKGNSVLEMVKAFETATGVKVPYKITDAREGDVDSMYADATKAFNVLGWKTNLTVADACRDTWNWQSKYPFGFQEANNNNNNDESKMVSMSKKNGDKCQALPGTGRLVSK